MAIKFPDAVTVAVADVIVDRVDAGAGAGELRIYNNTQPADPNAAITDTLLATVTFPDPAFGNAAVVGDNAEASLAGPTVDETNATAGTAGWFAAVDSDANIVFTGTVTATGGGGDLELNTLTIGAGGTVQVTAFTFRFKRDP